MQFEMHTYTQRISKKAFLFKERLHYASYTQFFRWWFLHASSN